MVLTSFKTQVDAMSLPPKFIFRPILDNYTRVLAQNSFLRYYSNSLVVCVASVALSLVIGVPCSYILARYGFKRRRTLTLWILSVRVAPPITFLIPFFIMFRRLHLIDTFQGLIIIYTSVNLTLSVILVRGFFKDIPLESEESARLEGCTPIEVFLRISLPLALTGILATASLIFILTWNELMFALVLTNRSATTIPVGIFTYIGYNEIRWGELTAASTLALVPVLLFLIFSRNYLVRGLTFGAVK